MRSHLLQSANTNRQPRPVLRWVLHRGDRFVTCELDVAATGDYEVSVVPHWNVAASVIERWPSAMAAFERHAQLARGFREAGWTVLEHLHPRRSRIAA
jgi:hypothetical protein